MKFMTEIDIKNAIIEDQNRIPVIESLVRGIIGEKTGQGKEPKISIETKEKNGSLSIHVSGVPLGGKEDTRLTNFLIKERIEHTQPHKTGSNGNSASSTTINLKNKPETVDMLTDHLAKNALKKISAIIDSLSTIEQTAVKSKIVKKLSEDIGVNVSVDSVRNVDRPAIFVGSGRQPN